MNRKNDIELITKFAKAILLAMNIPGIEGIAALAALEDLTEELGIQPEVYDATIGELLVTQGMRDADYDCTHRGQTPLNPCPA